MLTQELAEEFSPTTKVTVQNEEGKEEMNPNTLLNLSPEQKQTIYPYLRDSELEYIRTIHNLENEVKKYTIRMNKLYDALRKIQITSTGEIKRIATVAIEEDNYLSMK